MRAWDSVTQDGSLRPGPAAFAIFLAGLLLSLAPVSQRIEARYYDLLQGLQHRSGSPNIVLIDTGQMARSTGTVWEAARFPDLLATLGKAGARLVIPVEPPPLTSALPDSAQLATLAETNG
jgi:CHASE2 domain-containing sensor protein